MANSVQDEISLRKKCGEIERTRRIASGDRADLLNQRDAIAAELQKLYARRWEVEGGVQTLKDIEREIRRDPVDPPGPNENMSQEEIERRKSRSMRIAMRLARIGVGPVGAASSRA